ncbi:MAG: undecaprenyl-phosphate glucose phosphotransferase [Prevotellaceae bacterium]|jgi:putative colanic acid biosynthesis UDP-glucose lipid carrier transferase|nr:undecaprenyl-phosphate glucose phosphotransferase [Prevotellaceae bacterium]
MKGIWRYKDFFLFIFVVEDIILLNLLYFLLMQFMNLAYRDSYLYLCVIINLGYLLSITIIKAIENFRELTISKILEHNAYRLLVTTIIMLGYLFFTKTSEEISRLFILVFYTSAYILLFFAHWFTRKAITFTFLSRSKSVVKAVILGAGLIGRKIRNELSNNIYLGIKILGFFDDNLTQKDNEHILGTLAQAKEYIKAHQIETIYCTLPLSAQKKILDFLNFAEQNIINFHVVPSISYYTNTPIVMDTICNIPVLSIRKVPLSHTHNAVLKRAFDVVVSLIFLTTLFPVIYLILGILIKLSSPGPVFFVQERTGLKGQNFKCYKFRSMKCNGEANTRQATANDERKTRIGDFIRRTNLDELPQFINVLKGDMSIVGPRPHMLHHTHQYSQLVNKYMVRHFVKSGITGWAQINGFRGETNKLEEMEGRIKKDIWYLENWSMALDIEIIIRTFFMMIAGDRKAY